MTEHNAVDPQTYKDALSQWSSGVAVVTTVHEGTPGGLTASSFTSVSLDPPLVLVCVAKDLFAHQLLEGSGVYAVNILSSEQVEWGKLFAGMYPEVEDRFAEIDYETAVTGSPILPGVRSWIDCRVRQAHDGGDHTIFVGNVVAGGTAEDTGAPLGYANRQWGRFAPLEEES